MLSLNNILAGKRQEVFRYTIMTKLTSQQILPTGFPKTNIYAYSGDCSDSLTGEFLGEVASWPGPAILVRQGSKVEIVWRNGLTGKHMFAIEKNLNFMTTGLDFNSFIPNVAHIHGMSNPSQADGMPEAWFTNEGRQGADYYT